MPKFSAATAAEPLSYDFRPYYDETGTVDEPTDDQVAEFYANLGRTLERALGETRTAGVDMTNAEQVGQLFLGLEPADHRALFDELLDLHGAVCGERPTREALAALPYRLRQAWYGAVQGWLRPEA